MANQEGRKGSFFTNWGQHLKREYLKKSQEEREFIDRKNAKLDAEMAPMLEEIFAKIEREQQEQQNKEKVI
ncbi:hypothetical protein [Marinospirillum minutulum]|uniref:hypothetical protein n=1 Tax=Marinospirillum minutulum TaxID=64974 RepID=UPI00040F3864|nr:hypothetical protein [Marinospirillum minutulum]